jgi:acetyltransferase-like isoleucine patch superfamily enzyme
MLSNIEYIISKIIKKLHLRAMKNSLIHKNSSVGPGTQFINSTMDRHSFCGYDCIIINTSIGGFCSIAGNCEIGGASHSIDWVSTSPVFNENKDQIKKKYSYHKYNTSQDTKIGNDVWIAAKCIIKAGVTIGDGAVVGMGSVVTKDIPPYEIWAGNPARLIRKRFDDTTIARLLEIEWWEYDDEILEKYAEYFNDVPKFLEEVSR